MLRTAATTCRFLIYKRRNSTSLKNRSHLVPFSLNTIGLPSDELHHQSEVISGSNLPSKPHVNYYDYSPAKPILYYDFSLFQSFSLSRSYFSYTTISSLQWRQMNKLDFPQICLNLGNCRQKRRQGQHYNALFINWWVSLHQVKWQEGRLVEGKWAHAWFRKWSE